MSDEEVKFCLHPEDDEDDAETVCCLYPPKEFEATVPTTREVRIEVSTKTVNCLAFEEEQTNCLLSASSDGEVRIFNFDEMDPDNKKPIRQFEPCPGLPLTAASFNSTGEKFSSS